MDGDATKAPPPRAKATSYAESISTKIIEKEDIHKRTQEINVRHYFSTDDVISAITKRFAPEEAQKILEGVTGSREDKKRFWITYKTISIKEQISSKGFSIHCYRNNEESIIDPVSTFTKMTFTNVPYFISQNEIIEELSKMGEVAPLDAQTGFLTRDGVRNGFFKINVKFVDQTPTGPVFHVTTITVRGETLEMENDNRPLVCEHCGKKGHLQQRCRTRMHPGNIERFMRITGEQEARYIRFKEMEIDVTNRMRSIAELDNIIENVNYNGENWNPDKEVEQVKREREALAAKERRLDEETRIDKSQNQRRDEEKRKYKTFIDKHFQFMPSEEKEKAVKEFNENVRLVKEKVLGDHEARKKIEMAREAGRDSRIREARREVDAEEMDRNRQKNYVEATKAAKEDMVETKKKADQVALKASTVLSSLASNLTPYQSTGGPSGEGEKVKTKKKPEIETESETETETETEGETANEDDDNDVDMADRSGGDGKIQRKRTSSRANKEDRDHISPLKTPQKKKPVWSDGMQQTIDTAQQAIETLRIKDQTERPMLLNT